MGQPLIRFIVANALDRAHWVRRLSTASRIATRWGIGLSDDLIFTFHMGVFSLGSVLLQFALHPLGGFVALLLHTGEFFLAFFE